MGQTKKAPGIWEASRGRYRIRVRGTDPGTGKLQERDRVVACTLREAKRIREEWHAELVGGIGAPPPIPTLRACATSWLVGKKSRCRRQTLETWARHLDLHILPTFGDFYVDKITRADIEEWVQSQATRSTPGTVNARLTILRAILREAAIEYGIADPSVLIRGLPVPCGPGGPSMTAGELARLLPVIRAESLPGYTLAFTLALTGMRWSEAIGLRWPDIDRERRTITISRALVRGTEGPTKSGRVRIISVPFELAEAFDEHRRWQMANQCPGLAEGWLWVARRGTPINGSAWYRPLTRWCEAAGIGRKTPHSFRRAHVDWMREARVDSVVEHALVGHTDDKMRERYSTVRAPERRDAAERVARIAVGGGGSGGGSEG